MAIEINFSYIKRDFWLKSHLKSWAFTARRRHGILPMFIRILGVTVTVYRIKGICLAITYGEF